MELLTLVIAGSVDDGKSTLIGRLLYDTGNVYEDQIQAVENTEHIEDELDYSLFTDGLEAEREQKITIDVAYRYFSSNQRTFIIADVPGHEEYTRNMVTGASHSQVALIVIDARKGMTVQTRRHFFVLSLLNIPHVAVVVNKMDMVSYDQGVFENIRDDVQLFTRNIGIKNIQFIPVSALKGDMVATRGNNLLWYFGQTVLEYIHDVPVISSRNMVDARFPVQYVVRPDQDFRGYAGTVAGGVFLVGDNIKVLPSGVESFIEHISVAEEDVSYAFNGQAAVMSFVDQIDVSRGDIVVRVGNEPIVSNNIDAVVFWFNKQPAVKKNRYIIKQTTKETFCFINTVFSVIDVLNGEYQEASQVELNQIGKVRFTTHEPFVFDSYKKNKKLGSFILIDEVTGDTVAAGVITPSEKKMLPDIQEEPLLLDVPKKNITLEEKVELSKIIIEHAFLVHPNLFVACSFGKDSRVIADLVMQIKSDALFVSIDTGYEFPETLRFAKELEQEIHMNLLWVRPTEDDISEIKSTFANSFIHEGQYMCCAMKKPAIVPILDKYDAWITGLRRDESVQRQYTPIIEKSENIVKYNPIAFWTKDDVWEYLRTYKLSYHPLYNEGYTSLGCEPCTKKSDVANEERKGRFHDTGNNECGLHI